MTKYAMEKIKFDELGEEGYMGRLQGMKSELARRLKEKKPKKQWRNLVRKIRLSEKFLCGELV